MFQIIRSTPLPFLKKTEIYFDKNPTFKNIFCTSFLFSPVKKNLIGFKRYSSQTMVINLTEFQPESLLKSFRYSHRAKIRKAENAGLVFGVENSIETFLGLYNPFALKKGLPLLRKERLLETRKNLIIFKAVIDNEILGMATVLYDDKAGLARGYWIASEIADESDKMKKRLISKATLALYYKSMVYFLNKGYKTFDLGGYWQEDDPKHKGLNEFKSGFHGKVVLEYSYRSYFEVLFISLKRLVRPKEFFRN